MAIASLAFTTLLALVPLVTVSLSILSALPWFDGLVGRLDNFFVDVLLPSRSGKTIAAYVTSFAHKSRKLTGMGLVLLGLTSFFLLHTIERVFNHLWGAKRPRHWLRRVRLYSTVIVLGPLLLAIFAGLLSYAVTVSLGFFDESAWVHREVLKAASLILLGGFFVFLYYSIPNASVQLHHAVKGALLAVFLFALMQHGFELYLTKFASYSAVYGSLAALPIFLVWLYLSWGVIMVGGLLVATLGQAGQSSC